MKRSESKYFNTAECMDKAFLALLEKKDFAYITVKEICEKAGVNRSTFYLHYETVADLLEECIAYMDRQFLSYFSAESKFAVDKIHALDIQDLYLITPEYLLPFLQYVKENKRLFRTAIEKSDVLGSESKMNAMFCHVFSPIMDRYRVAEEKKPFLLSFYIDGMIGIVKRWIDGDCRESVAFILEIILSCVQRPPQ